MSSSSDLGVFEWFFSVVAHHSFIVSCSSDLGVTDCFFRFVAHHRFNWFGSFDEVLFRKGNLHSLKGDQDKNLEIMRR